MRLILYSHPNCSLCTRLEAMLRPHLARLSNVELIKRDIADDPAWLELYRERIPVLEFDGKVILEGRPEEVEVRQAMANLPAPPR